MLLWCSVGSWSRAIKRKHLIFLIPLILAGISYYYYIYLPKHRIALEAAYVVPEELEVVDTPAEVHLAVASLKNGDRVEVLLRTRNWVMVRVAAGREGWVESKSLLDGESYEKAQRTRRDLERLPAQAAGHLTALANLRAEPSREAPQLAQLSERQKVEVFGRRVVDRPAQADQAAPTAGREAWYLIRAGPQAGWVLGRFVTLDVPEALSPYAQGMNLVAWLVLNTVEDNGQQVPQYLAADRIGTAEFDFNHIRVFTWWAKHQRYATAYVESGVDGFFPIRVVPGAAGPTFRLRLVDETGRKYQKVYRTVGTITRPLGTVEGWESDENPARMASARRKRR